MLYYIHIHIQHTDTHTWKMVILKMTHTHTRIRTRTTLLAHKYVHIAHSTQLSAFTRKIHFMAAGNSLLQSWWW